MKRYLFSLLAAVFLVGCANIQTSPLAVATHNDLIGAATVYEQNGFPAVGAVYRAADAQLTLCEAGIASMAPKVQQPPAGAGPLTALATLDVAIGTATWIPAAVKINCKGVPILIFPKP
jgi:hypothetical protein